MNVMSPPPPRIYGRVEEIRREWVYTEGSVTIIQTPCIHSRAAGELRRKDMSPEQHPQSCQRELGEQGTATHNTSGTR